MNESLLLQFESGGRPLKVADFRASLGVTFDGHADASPLNVAIGLQPVFPRLLDPVRQRHDWRDREFLLDVSESAGGLRLSGYQGDPQGLPPGVYDITVEVESYRFEDSGQRVILHEGQSAAVVLHEKPDPRRLELHDNFDALTEGVLRAPGSAIDGVPLLAWLASPDPRLARKACLLNILAKLRVPPDPSHGFTEPLTSGVESLFFADVDRVYAVLRPDVSGRLEALVRSGLWVREGTPAAPIHALLLDRMDRAGIPDAAGYSLTSYRQGGRNCVQMVVAAPPPGQPLTHEYADIDIDLGNPLWDLEGVFVHLGELLDSGRTDHLELRSRLAAGPTADFMYYDIVGAAPASHAG
ncbi:MAG TPA: hypothetical protein VHA11_15400 [Bryobacteraceae bacterium]|nr:hypothetical protein [Bryobacteraceae bacterium]